MSYLSTGVSSWEELCYRFVFIDAGHLVLFSVFDIVFKEFVNFINEVELILIILRGFTIYSSYTVFILPFCYYEISVYLPLYFLLLTYFDINIAIIVISGYFLQVNIFWSIAFNLVPIFRTLRKEIVWDWRIWYLNDS